jgi:hypothetical protein
MVRDGAGRSRSGPTVSAPRCLPPGFAPMVAELVDQETPVLAASELPPEAAE